MPLPPCSWRPCAGRLSLRRSAALSQRPPAHAKLAPGKFNCQLERLHDPLVLAPARCNQVAMQFWDKAPDVNWTFTFTNGSSSASSRGTCTSSQESNHSTLGASDCVQQRVDALIPCTGGTLAIQIIYLQLAGIMAAQCGHPFTSMTDSRGSLRAPQRSASPADPARSTSAGLHWHTSHQDTLIASNSYPAAALRSRSA